jgi:sphingomyelin phosphodiesterase acid-like 3
LGDWDTDSPTSGLPSPAFLASYASTWSEAISRRGAAAPQATSGSTGSYSTSFPIDPRGRFISLYTQPWAAECTTGCGTGAGSPGVAELAWLSTQLAEARARGQRVWLLGHIPPGVSAPGTAGNLAAGNTCAGSLAPFYADGFATQLQDLYRQNGDLLRFGFFAHQHLDDFRLQRDAAGGPLFGMKLLPSITPALGNNPAFVQFSYDPEVGAITEATTYTLTNLAAASTTTPGAWAPEYRFTQAYGQPALDAAGVAGAVAAIQAGGAARTTYTTFYPSSNPAGPPAGGFSPFTSYGCAFDRLTVADFGGCFCGP